VKGGKIKGGNVERNTRTLGKRTLNPFLERQRPVRTARRKRGKIDRRKSKAETPLRL